MCLIGLYIAGYPTYIKQQRIYQPKKSLPQLQLYLPHYQYPLKPTYKRLAMKMITNKHQLSPSRLHLNFSQDSYFPTFDPSR
jgi:hypothetical protein